MEAVIISVIKWNLYVCVCVPTINSTFACNELFIKFNQDIMCL